MEIATNGQTGAISPTLGTAATPERALTSDFETFLRMLTVQMQNQDPLNPVDSSDYATQLATFSGVEQQVLTNDLLKGLVGQFSSGGFGDLANWIGMEAKTGTAAQFSGTPVSVQPQIASGADDAELVVTDANGAEVQRFTINAATDNIDWAGVRDDGTPFPAGEYNFSTISYRNGAVIDTRDAQTYSRITELRMIDNAPKLILSDGSQIDPDTVTALRE